MSHRSDPTNQSSRSNGRRRRLSSSAFVGPCSGHDKAVQRRSDRLAGPVPGWQYPAVIDTLTGEIRYDNYGGKWGDQSQIDHFLQIYAVERTKIEARKKGLQFSEQTLQDGSIKVQLTEGGT